MPFLLLIYALSTAYLAAFASPTMFYYGNVVFHIVAGIGLLIVWIAGRNPALNIRDTLTGTPAARIVKIGASIVLGIGLAFGLLITVVGAAGHWRWLLPFHLAFSIAGAIPLLMVGLISVSRRGTVREVRFVAVACILAVLAAIAAPLLATSLRMRSLAAYTIRNPSLVPSSMNDEGRGPGSPFFPSSGDTNVHRTIPANFFMYYSN